MARIEIVALEQFGSDFSGSLIPGSASQIFHISDMQL